MKLLKFLNRKEIEEPQYMIPDNLEIIPEANIYYAPLSGNVVGLEKLDDSILSSGIFGEGIAIKPVDEIVYSPINGRISALANTKHAIGITGDDGAEVLIHIGIDTINMQGDGFVTFVEEDQIVEVGQPLIKFSKEKIKEAGFDDITTCLLVNSDKYKMDIKKLGPIEAGKKIIEYR